MLHFLGTDFSLETWRDENNVAGVVTGYAVNQLMDTLKINDFLLDTPCVRTSTPYSLATNGIYNGEFVYIVASLPKVGEKSGNFVREKCWSNSRKQHKLLMAIAFSSPCILYLKKIKIKNGRKEVG